MSEWLEGVRVSGWCRASVAVGALVVGCVILAVFPLTAIPVAVGVSLWSVGLVVIGLRLLILQYSEDRRAPSSGCQKCGYDLTGNVSGVCPECGAAALGRGSAKPDEGVN